MSAWQDIARVVAPTVATGLFGPAGGLVASVVAGFLFPDDPAAKAKATPTSVAERIARIADPVDVARLREAELALRKLETENEFRFADLARQDTADARALQRAAIGAGDKTANHLAWFVVASFTLIALAVLVVCVRMLTTGLPTSASGAEFPAETWVAVSGFVGAILGYFSANAQQVVGFYFGSSAGSKEKAAQIGESAANAVAALGSAVSRPAAPAPAAPTPVVAAELQTPEGPMRVVAGSVPGRAEPDAAPRPDPRIPVLETASADAEARWKACAAFVLGAEGGVADEEHDLGGLTNMGVTKETLAHWRGRPVTDEEVRTLTEEEALQLFRAEFWALAHCDQLPRGVDLCVFDTAILRGPVKALRMLQEAAGLPDAEVDGIWGPDTEAAVRRRDPAELVKDLADARAAFHRRRVVEDPTQQKFLKGWLNRVEKLRAEALRVAGTRAAVAA